MKLLLMMLSFLAGHVLFGQSIGRHALVISEIMADPSPPVALPAAEFIELYNVSADTVNLFQWSIRAGNNQVMINRSFQLLPGQLIALCSQAAAQAFDPTVLVLGLPGFPALDNDGTLIELLAPGGYIIHAIEYQKSWYRSLTKNEGGWSLEMIDPLQPCLGEQNWQASLDANGGTPGSINSVKATIMDDQPPALLRTYSPDSLSIVAVFNETLDSFSASVVAAYRLRTGPGMKAVFVKAPLFREVLLTTDMPLEKNKEYLVEVQGIKDCAGNTIQAFRRAKAGIPVVADSMDLVINELLFDPPAGGSDYIELYNSSKKILNLQEIFLAGRNGVNQLQSVVACSTVPWQLFPDEYIVLTTNATWIRQQYLIKEPLQLLELTTLPALPDDKGVLVVLTREGKVIDELRYAEKWHFPLLVNREGVALERLNYRMPTQDQANWSSAASTAGYGTPAQINSQVVQSATGANLFRIYPDLFSPDNDGINDYTMIAFNLDAPGYMGSITISDVAGRPVRYLVNNANLSQSGSYKWDGLDQNQLALAPGLYIVQLEIFNLKGRRKKHKGVVTLAAAFK